MQDLFRLEVDLPNLLLKRQVIQASNFSTTTLPCHPGQFPYVTLLAIVTLDSFLMLLCLLLLPWTVSLCYFVCYCHPGQFPYVTFFAIVTLDSFLMLLCLLLSPWTVFLCYFACHCHPGQFPYVTLLAIVTLDSFLMLLCLLLSPWTVFLCYFACYYNALIKSVCHMFSHI